MDPNANLAEQAELLTLMGEQDGVLDEDDTDRLIELRDALKGWLKGGGFAPDWSAFPEASYRFQCHLPIAPFA